MQVDLEQGSLEWHEHRAKYNNASEASVIMGCAPKYWGMTKRILWEQKQGLRGSNVSPDNPAIEHGNNMEAAALACFNDQMHTDCKPGVFVDGDYSASLDGIGTDSEGQSVKVEIKCPFKGVDSQVWKMARDGEIAEYYDWQMVHQHFVAPTELSFFFVYISDDINITLPHTCSDDMIAELVSAWDDFNSKEPEPDFIERDDEVIKDLIANHRALVLMKNQLDKDLKSAEKKLKDEAGGNVIAFGTKIQQVTRKGNVDYSTVPNLDGVDLEPYRKESSSYYKITHPKADK